MSCFLLTAGAYLQLPCNHFWQFQNKSSGSKTWERPRVLLEKEQAPLGIKLRDFWAGLWLTPDMVHFLFPPTGVETPAVAFCRFVPMSIHPDAYR